MSARDAVAFEHEIPSIGRLWLRRLELSRDLPIIHDWVRRDYARYWGLVGKSLDQVAAAYTEIERRADVYLGFCGDQPAFLVESYDPRDDAVAAHYAAAPGDRGMHVLVAPAGAPIAGFTWAVFTTVMELVFSDPSIQRIVVEPDVRNHRIHALNRRAGFHYHKLVELPHKTAHLAFCTRADYRAARARDQATASDRLPSGPTAIAHLEPDVWAAANRALVGKAISEFTHEQLIRPIRHGHDDGEWSWFQLAVGDADTIYRFRARILSLDHWDIDAASLTKLVAGAPAAIDALALIIELRDPLAIDPAKLPVYLEEIASTLYGAAYKRAFQRHTAGDLVHAGFQDIEAAMTEGHPAFVANSGRVGFDARDYLAYAPEAGAPVKLVWLAAHRRNTEFTAAADLSYDELLRQELGAETLAAFRGELLRQALAPDDYIFMPVHPWQWDNRLAMVFAPDLAARDLVFLGTGPDSYQAQQSIRTFFNRSHPTRRYVKTALSVLNMGFMRGLSADYMRNTPPINDWIHELVAGDAYLARHGFGILREVAAVGYRNRYFEAALPKQSPYRKMLAALWRESPVPRLAPGERVMTMAALLHRDRDGVALLPQLVRASGLSPDAWLRRYLACYLAPLLHCFYRHDLVFMPHGENVILVLEDHVPVRAFMKDIAEEVAVLDPTRVVPDAVRRICVSVPDAVRPLSVFTDVFDGILRYVSQILRAGAGYPERQFWATVAACVLDYRREHPELAAKIARDDLFAPELARVCLNRLQLRNNLQMVDLTDPLSSMLVSGTLHNPIAEFAERATSERAGHLPGSELAARLQRVGEPDRGQRLAGEVE